MQLIKRYNLTFSLICFIILISFTFGIIPYNVTSAAIVHNSEKKVLYLTFDDGPSVITDELLDILKFCNVKATFFVVGKEIVGREDMLKRICREGHSIGLHTYSHNLHRIYKNQDAFVNEMIETSKLVKMITGCSTNIIRFPGGSSKHLTKAMLEKLHTNNFKVYDWNSSLEDGVCPNMSVNQLVKNSKKYKHGNSRIFLLMHCNSNNRNTIKALPQIIEYYKNMGYSIEPITEKTEEYYYRIKE